MIKIEHLTKTYTGFPKKNLTVKPTLNNISLDIKPGERVAIIGRNGAGKTTLLRLISGSLKKTSGEIKVLGNVYPLMGVGLGINEKFTGRENIYSSLVYNGFALQTEALKAIENDIESFTELKDFLDRPFYTYSLGMKMRLMFAIATAAKPEIFLIDEVLGSGDSYFTLKNQNRLTRVIDENNATLLLVAHSTQLLKKFCDRGIWINDGKIFLDSNINEVCAAYDAYIERISSGSKHKMQHLSDFKSRLDNGIEVYTWQNNSEVFVSKFEVREKNDMIYLLCSLTSQYKKKYSLRLLITLWGRDGIRIARFENDFNSLDFRKRKFFEITAYFKKLLLPFGTCDITISIFRKAENDLFAERLERVYAGSNMATIVSQKNFVYNFNSLPHIWARQ